MDKRSFSLIASPNKVPVNDNCKKLKVSISPKKLSDENNGNSLNFVDELEGLCFDDDDEDDFCNAVCRRILTHRLN